MTLPLPPAVNVMYRVWRGRAVLSAEARRYKQGAKLRALTQGMRPLTGAVALSVVVYRKRKAGDLDGFLKCLLDALQGVAFENDAQITEIHARREDDPSNPRVEVRVEAA